MRGKNRLDLSDLELAINLSSTTAFEREINKIEETTLRRSKRLSKTNRIVRLNNPVNEDDYWNHRKTPQPVTATGDIGKNAGAGQLRKPINRSHNQMDQPTETDYADHRTPDLPPA